MVDECKILANDAKQEVISLRQQVAEKAHLQKALDEMKHANHAKDNDISQLTLQLQHHEALKRELEE